MIETSVVFAIRIIFAMIVAIALSISVRAATGDLDTTFGNGGKVTSDLGLPASPGFSGVNDRSHAVAIQPDGKIVVAGTMSSSGQVNRIAVVRYNANGTVDTAFGNGGTAWVREILLPSIDEGADAIAIQPDGKIIVVGTRYNPLFPDVLTSIVVTRFNSNGGLDSGFGSFGQQTIQDNDPNTPRNWFGKTIAIQADGKIVVGGYYGNYASQQCGIALARLSSAGSLDTSFGSGGEVKQRIGPNCTSSSSSNCNREEYFSLALQSDNKILIAGFAWNGTDQDFAMARFTTSGSLDTTFGNSGKVLSPMGSGDDRAYSIVLLRDNKILLAGSSKTTSGDYDLAMARFNSDGTIDSTFGTSGSTIAHISNEDDEVASVIVGVDSTILLAGYYKTNNARNFVVASYNANGSQDDTFGSSGTTLTSIGNGDDVATSAAFQNGKIVVAGYSWNGSNDDFAVARYDFNYGSRPSSVTKMIPYNGGVITAFENGMIYFSPDGQKLGGGGNTIRVYSGTQRVTAMIPYQNGVITAFSANWIYYSPNGRRLGGGGSTVRSYTGTQAVVAMIPYQNGVITAFSANWIYYSPDGLNLGGGGSTVRSYTGTQAVVAMIPYQNGVLTAFSGGGIYYSPDGLNLGGGGSTIQYYAGTRVSVMTQFQNGVITAFNNGRSYYSPDGQNPAGGGSTIEVDYTSATIVMIVPYQNGVLTFLNAGQYNFVYYSHDGRNLSGNIFVGNNTDLVYFGGRRVLAMVPYQGGVIVAFDSWRINFSPNGYALPGGGSTVNVYD